jgi:hypothetical protein
LVGAVIATRQGRERRAEDRMRKAGTAGKWRGEDRDDFGTEFGLTNVSMHAISVAVELVDGGTALRRTETSIPRTSGRAPVSPSTWRGDRTPVVGPPDLVPIA